MNHYVYVSYRPDTKEFYIGKRSTIHNPYFDGSYVGSGFWPQNMSSANIPLEKEVLKVCVSKKEAHNLEVMLLRKFRNHKYSKNRTSSGDVKMENLYA